MNKTSSSRKRSRSLSPVIDHPSAKFVKREESSSSTCVLKTDWELKYLRDQFASSRAKLLKAEATLSQLQKEVKESNETCEKQKNQLTLQTRKALELVQACKAERTKFLASARAADAAKAAAEAKHFQFLEQLGKLVSTSWKDKPATSSTLPGTSSEADQTIMKAAEQIDVWFAARSTTPLLQ